LDNQLPQINLGMGDQVRTVETVNYRYNNVPILQIILTHGFPSDRRKRTGQEPSLRRCARKTHGGRWKKGGKLTVKNTEGGKTWNLGSENPENLT
jgi:hypothetical protein